jgi:hypothetical protein
MGKSTTLWGREVVLGGAAIAVLAMLINSDMWQGSVLNTQTEASNLQRCKSI